MFREQLKTPTIINLIHKYALMFVQLQSIRAVKYRMPEITQFQTVLVCRVTNYRKSKMQYLSQLLGHHKLPEKL